MGSTGVPRVLNVHRDDTTDSVYGGRPAWPEGLGNPFVIGKDGTREEVVAKHREAFLADPLWVATVKLYRGCDWRCFCAPLSCHCDVYLEVANE